VRAVPHPPDAPTGSSLASARRDGSGLAVLSEAVRSGRLTQTSTFTFGEIEELTHLIITDDGSTDVLNLFRACRVEVIAA